MERVARIALLVTVVLQPLAVAADHPQEARSLSLKQDTVKGKETLTWVAKRPPPLLPATSPLAVGGTVRVIGHDQDVALDLPASGWSVSRAGTAYTYQNRLAPGGPSGVKMAVVKGGSTLKVRAKDTGIDLDDPAQGSVSIVLTIGDDVYCSICTSPSMDRPGTYLAKQCPAPAACAPTSTTTTATSSTTMTTTSGPTTTSTTLPCGTLLREWGGTGTGDGQFDGLAGIAVNFSYVIAADSNNHRVQRFGHDGHFFNAWGAPGSGPGEFAFPSDVGIDGNDEIYVADTMNHRVQKFDRYGTFLLAWGGRGSANGAFVAPQGIDAIPGDPSTIVLVADTGNHRVQMFTGSGTFRTKWGVPGGSDGEFQAPRDVTAFGRTFDVAVADTGNRRVQLFDLVGFQLDAVFLAAWPAGDTPASIAVGAHNNGTVLYVADEANDRVYQFDPTGTMLNSWPVAGRPRGVYWGGGDEVFVANAATNTIQVFSCQ